MRASNSFDRNTKVMRRVFDTISDNAANAGVVLGGPARKARCGWTCAGCLPLLFKNGVIEETGVAAGVLNHPAMGVAWLANKLANFGEHLAAGEIVLGGSFTRPTPAVVGDSLHADYGRAGFDFIPDGLKMAAQPTTLVLSRP